MNWGDNVHSLHQIEYETYRIILPGRDATELFLVSSGERLALPLLRVPRWQRVTESLTASMRAKWGCEVICLFSADITVVPDPNEIRYQVMECGYRSEERNARTRWFPVASLASDSFADPADYRAVKRSLAQWKAYQEGQPPGPFAKPGWFEQLRSWVEETVQPLGMHLTGVFRQLSASPSFNLVRLESDGPAIWFKAVGAPNPREFLVTIALAQLFPKYVARVLASRPEWNGWLAQEVEGTTLAESQKSCQWRAAATALANLQIDSIGREVQLLKASARDLRTAALSNLLQPFIRAMAELMQQQRKIPPPVLTEREVLLLGEQIEDALCQFEDLGIPAAIGHLDLNPGNIVVSSNACRFLDWAEAYVGNSFLSFEHLLAHHNRIVGADSALEAQLTAAYIEPWKRLYSADHLTKALKLAPLLGVYAYAAGSGAWRDQDRLQIPGTAGYLRSLTRRMNREASRLFDRRAQCRK
jgi:hypothetical protein